MKDDGVTRMRPALVGDGFVMDPDQVLEANKGRFFRVVLVGETEDGDIKVAGTHSAPESLMLLAWATAFLVNNRVMR